MYIVCYNKQSQRFVAFVVATNMCVTCMSLSHNSRWNESRDRLLSLHMYGKIMAWCRQVKCPTYIQITSYTFLDNGW